MLCIYYTAKNPPWGSPTEDHQVLIQYIAGFIYSWKNLHLCCFVPAITQDFREKNMFIEWHSYYRFIQTNVNKNLWPVFPCLNRLVLNFIVKLNQQLKTFSNIFLQNSLQEVYLKPSKLLFGSKRMIKMESQRVHHNRNTVATSTQETLMRIELKGLQLWQSSWSKLY